MKRLFRICAIGLAVVVFCIAAFIGGVEWQTRHSARELTTLVAALPPGMPFSQATERLGGATRIVEDPEEIRSFAQQNGAQFIPGSTLHLFMHRGPPLRWIFVYVDPASQKITHAEWRDM